PRFRSPVIMAEAPGGRDGTCIACHCLQLAVLMRNTSRLHGGGELDVLTRPKQRHADRSFQTTPTATPPPILSAVTPAAARSYREIGTGRRAEPGSSAFRQGSYRRPYSFPDTSTIVRSALGPIVQADEDIDLAGAKGFARCHHASAPRSEADAG